jgi:hypothetical protein
VCRRVSRHARRLENLHNFRDLAEADPTRLKHGLLFRSADTARMTKEDCAYLDKELHVKTVIDFREAKEAGLDSGDRSLRNVYAAHAYEDFQRGERAAADRWIIFNPYSHGIPRYTISLLPWYLKLYVFFLYALSFVYKPLYSHIAALVLKKFNKIGLEGLYRYFVLHAGHEICRTLTICTEPSNTPLLFNCFHGKDRTGITGLFVCWCVLRPCLSRQRALLLYHHEDRKGVYSSATHKDVRVLKPSPPLWGCGDKCIDILSLFIHFSCVVPRSLCGSCAHSVGAWRGPREDH